MPCYHFTFHGYGTWMPDEDDGYVKRGKGHLPQDVVVAAEYRREMTGDEAQFEESQQKTMIDEVHVTAAKTNLRVHYVATEPTHIHALLSWKDDRTWLKVRTSLKSSLSRRLKRPWSPRVAQRRWQPPEGRESGPLRLPRGDVPSASWRLEVE